VTESGLSENDASLLSLLADIEVCRSQMYCRSNIYSERMANCW